MYKNMEGVMVHLGKLDPHCPSQDFRKFQFVTDRGIRIPVGIPAIPFLEYPKEPTLLSFNPRHQFSRQELCNMARHPMLLALLLSSVSSTRAMLQLTRPPWQPPLYRTSHMVNIMWNWLRENWMIKDSGDTQWYDVVSFT